MGQLRVALNDHIEKMPVPSIIARELGMERSCKDRSLLHAHTSPVRERGNGPDIGSVCNDRGRANEYA